MQNWFLVFFSFERDKTQVQYFYGSYCILILDMLRATLQGVCGNLRKIALRIKVKDKLLFMSKKNMCAANLT
jgi:hypothetical protein